MREGEAAQACSQLPGVGDAAVPAALRGSGSRGRKGGSGLRRDAAWL